MTVFDLIKELTNFDPNADVTVTYEGDEDTVCPECKHDFSVSIDKSVDIYDVRADRKYRSQVEIRVS